MKGSTKFWISCAVFGVGYLVYHITSEWPTLSEERQKHIVDTFIFGALLYTGLTTVLLFVFDDFDDEGLYEMSLHAWPPYWVYFVVRQLNRLLDKIFD